MSISIHINYDPTCYLQIDCTTLQVKILATVCNILNERILFQKLSDNNEDVSLIIQSGKNQYSNINQQSKCSFLDNVGTFGMNDDN